jgi:hypothetical protein
MTLKLVAGLTLVSALSGCSTSAPSAPAQTSLEAIPAIPPMASIAGYVADTAFRPIAGARVLVVDGPQAGMIAFSDTNGRFSLTGPFARETKFRASDLGHRDITDTAPAYCQRDTCFGNLFFYLPLASANTDVTGEYTATVEADPACPDLPAVARTRTYPATITLNPSVSAGTSVSVVLHDAPFLGTYNKFTIGVAGGYLALNMGGGEVPVVEQLPGNTYVAFGGSGATNFLAGSPIALSLDGWVEYCSTKTPMGASYGCGIDSRTGRPIPGEVVTVATCTSPNHRLTLTRR